LVLLAVAVIGVIFYWQRNVRRDEALLRSTGTELQANADLLAYAIRRAQPIYQEHCASCHGAGLKGDRSRGIPNLSDSVWLYGNGQITDIEQTILYGIRSGHPKAHNLTDMPGLGRTGQLNKGEVNDVVEYVLLIGHQPHDEAAAERGKVVFFGQGVCYDCHSSDGYGVSDYGTPGLTGRGDSWMYGGDRATLYKSVFDGRHGLCPAWVNKLSFAEIRALAAFLNSRSGANASSAQPKKASNGASTPSSQSAGT
jgi:cytochrome c oxidase cbb3-type subunit 3